MKLTLLRPHCHRCGLQSEDLEIVVEAYSALLCPDCREEFWRAFYRAEAQAEGLER